MNQEKRNENMEINTLERKKQEKMALSNKLKKEINALKEKRDEENKSVSRHKALRQQKNQEKDSKKSRLEQVQKELAKVQGELEKSYEAYKKEHNQVYWKYQTEPVSRKEEERILEKLEELEKKKEDAKKISILKKEQKDLKKEVRQITTEANIHHKIVTQRADRSEKYHQEMIKTYNQIDELEEEIDQLKEKISKVRSKNKAKKTVRATERDQMAEKSLEKFREQGKITLGAIARNE